MAEAHRCTLAVMGRLRATMRDEHSFLVQVRLLPVSLDQTVLNLGMSCKHRVGHAEPWEAPVHHHFGLLG